MKIFDMTTIRPNMGQTKTYEDFAKFLGSAPHRLGIVSRMHQDLTTSYLTEQLMNIYVNDAPKSKFQNINALLFEWELDVEYIKRVRLAADVSDTGANGALMTMAFTERYYEKYDTFRAEESKDLFIVLTPPIRKADNYWEVGVQLINPDRGATADLTALKAGAPTRFIANHHPELSEEGLFCSPLAA